MIYLDYNATTPMKPAVRSALLEAMERCGNASSVHRFGRIARRHIDEARACVAALAGVKPTQVVFTSGGTEANHLALHGIASSQVIFTAIEHDSVLVHGQGALKLPVTAEGGVDLSVAESILKSIPRGALVSVMLVNNETGVIQPVSEVARIAKAYGHKIHCDAAQAAGRLPIDFVSLGVDALSLSAHKIGGPQGVGALIVGEKLVLRAQQRGGGQELNRRAGTENTAGLVGFGVAAKLAADDVRDMLRLAVWRDRLQQKLCGIAGEDAVVLGAHAARVATTLCIAMRGVASETQVAALDLSGVAVSAGSACSSGKVKVSHVAQAMGFGSEIAGSVLRISLGWNTQPDEITRCIDAWQALYERVHKTKTKNKAA
jgi:cysteine desulfurase